MHLNKLTTVSFLLGAIAHASPAVNEPIQVNLRIEGAQTTECDGLNSGSNAQPGATAISALFDGASLNGFSFNGLFVDEFADFLINTIDSESSDGSMLWIIGVNFLPQPILQGCHNEINPGDQVIFVLIDSADPIFLKLLGPTTAQVDQTVTLTVIDGVLLTRIHGVQVDGQTTDGNGQVNITLTQVGVNSFKADGPGFVRSPRLDIEVSD